MRRAMALSLMLLSSSAHAVNYGNPLREEELPPEGKFVVMIRACPVEHVSVRRDYCRWHAKPYSAYGPVMCDSSAWTVANRWQIEQAKTGHDYFIEEWHCAKDASENGI